MKTRFALSLAVAVLLYSTATAQYGRDAQRAFIATTEDEVFELYDRMLDSTRLSNRFQVPYMRNMSSGTIFGASYIDDIDSRDTIMLFKDDIRSPRFYKQDGNPEGSRLNKLAPDAIK
jgi:hypothetical protein